jgi:hypothetical protein
MQIKADSRILEDFEKSYIESVVFSVYDAAIDAITKRLKDRAEPITTKETQVLVHVDNDETEYTLVDFIPQNDLERLFTSCSADSSIKLHRSKSVSQATFIKGLAIITNKLQADYVCAVQVCKVSHTELGECLKIELQHKLMHRTLTLYIESLK